jgi:hypothetical protein
MRSVAIYETTMPGESSGRAHDVIGEEKQRLLDGEQPAGSCPG